MKLIDMTCPHCSAHLKVNPEKGQAICEHCGATILIDDEVQHVQYDNAEEAGYNFEKGRQRAQAEAIRDAGNYSMQQNSEPPKKKRRTWLWVLGWICIFPLPLTILLLRKKNMKPILKYGIIAVAWILYLIIGLSGTSNKNGENGRSNNADTPSTIATDGSRDTIEAPTDNSKDTSPAETESNIKELSFYRSSDQTMKIGDSTSDSYVKVKVKNKDSFSPNDVLFISEDPEIATIEYTKDASTTNLYYRITGVSAGETYVYACSKDRSVTSKKIKVTVEGSGSNISDIAFSNPDELILKVGQDNAGTVKVTLKNTLEYSQDDVLFVSENPEIATITFEKSSYGKTVYYKIHAVSPGKTMVYAQSNDGLITSDKVSVTVPEPIDVESVTLDYDNMTLALGETATLSAVITPANADDPTVTWSSSDPSIATVDQDGKLIAIAKGTTTISAKAVNGEASSFELTVDGSKRVMSVRVTYPRQDDINIGDEWSYITEINGNNAGREYLVTVGETLTFHAKFTESDDDPDVGEASTSYTVTEDDILNGFTVTMDLYVTENGGRYSGKSAHFVVTYTFTVK